MGVELERRGQFAEAAIAYSNASVSAQALSRLQDALTDGQKAVQMAERAGDARSLGPPLARLGQVHLLIGAPQKAIPLLEQAIGLARGSRNPSLEMIIHSHLTSAYRRIGKLDLALEHARKALDSSAAAIQSNTIARHRSESERRRSLARMERAHTLALESLGWIFISLRQWENARPPLAEACDTASGLQIPQLIARAHLGLGVVTANLGDSRAAVTHLTEAIRIKASPAAVAAAQATLGRIYRKMGKLSEAEDALRSAVAGIEDLRSMLQTEELRESYFEDKADVYETLVLTLLDRRKAIEAFDFSERARARAFLDLLGNRVILSRGRDESLIAEERALRERIGMLKALPEGSPALDRELSSARDAYQAFLQRVRQVDREQASLMTVEPLTLSQVQAFLPEGSVLLEYFVTGQGRTILWTVERGAVSVRNLTIGRGEMARRVQAFRDLISARGDQPDLQRAGQELYDLLVRPGLQGRRPRELVIVPHGPLHYLPFQALMPGPGRYLLQETPLYYYTSASLMQFTRAKEQTGTPTIFAVGNPDFQDLTLSLPYAAREARGIATLFPDTVLAIGKAATKLTSREEIRRHSVLHFATHAEFDEADPLGTSLLLASTTGADSRLEVQEIFGLSLHASLVVLSACETALGKLSGGDEITGLTRAFIYAGTPSVITTLWQVNDRSAFELMREFYRQLRAGRNKAEALRLAQLTILDLHPRPYHWAAYELIGEPR
jgi:CHAT domain-containing protein